MEELSRIERETILKLAHEGAKGGYDFHFGGQRKRTSKNGRQREALMSSRHWITILNHLGKDGLNLIRRVGVSNRRKILYWLTEKGVIYAILNNANQDLLLAQAKKTEPEEKEITLLIELSKVMPKSLMKTAYEMLEGDKLNMNIFSELLAMSPEKYSTKTIAIYQKMSKIMKDLNPKFYEAQKKAMKENLELRKKIVDSF